ncbi:MFS transporter [Mycobacterium gordonae]|nr:sugar porter family MFS transporter [Mycobacterium gordonae]OBJ81423.1 MFS transporter [Mycobacterium gordonae]
MSRVGRMAGISAASVGVIYGYDLSNFASALRYITNDFHLSTHQQEMVTTALVIGQLAGTIGGGVLANTIGRKTSMVLVAAGYAVFTVLGAVAVVSLPMLVLVRFLLGLAVGVSVVVVPVFIAECAPAPMRGAVLVGYQLATVLGIIAGYLAAYLLADLHSWRWMLGLAALPAVLVVLLLLPIPDTARWYMLKGSVVPARQVLRCVEREADVEADLAEIARTLSEQRGGALTDMLRRPYWRATVFVVGLGFFAHVTGINAIVYYGPRLFAAIGFAGDFALLVLPALAQVAGLAAALVSLTLVDKLGRRPILLAGIATMIAADVLLIVMFASGSSAGSALLGLAGVVVFAAGFSLGFGSLLGVYAGESLPGRLRSMGSSAMLTADLVGSVIVAAVYLTMLDSLGGAGTYTVFGALALGAFVFVYRFAPETKGMQLEDIRHFWENAQRPTGQGRAGRPGSVR